MSINQAIYRSLQGGPASEPEIRKRSKFERAELMEALAAWKARGWAELHEDGRTSRYSLTDLGRRDMASRYPG